MVWRYYDATHHSQPLQQATDAATSSNNNKKINMTSIDDEIHRKSNI
jgi:hypothetical protein